MTNPAIRLATLAAFSMALAAAPPLVPVLAAGGGRWWCRSHCDPAAAGQPADHRARHPHHPEEEKKAKQSSLDDPGLVRRLPRGLCDDLMTATNLPSRDCAVEERSATTIIRTWPI